MRYPLAVSHKSARSLLKKDISDNETTTETWEDDVMRTIAAMLGVTTLLLVTPVAHAPPASAVTINVNVGFGIGSNLNRGRRLSCSEGERILRNRGFRDVRRIDCRGRYFVYRGWRRGNRYEVALNSRDGRVVDLRRLRW